MTNAAQFNPDEAAERELARQLAQLTAWSGPTPNLWRQALRRAGAPARRRVIRLPRLSGRLVTGLAAAAVFLAVAAGFRYSLDGARGLEKYAGGSGGERREVLKYGQFGTGQWFTDDFSSRAEQTPVVGDQLAVGYPVKRVSELTRGRERFGADFGLASVGVSQIRGAGVSDGRMQIAGSERISVGAEIAGRPIAGREVTTAPGERSVVRTATIELATDDVRAAVAKAALLPSAARGEFVQESSLTGAEPQIFGQLTLRVAAERLSEVLNELRQLGKVQSEKTTGEDVTAQMVDLEARLRNEQRVEQELLELVTKREDAALKDVLELRQSLANVRQSIEQLQAQRENLTRLVNLATVLVIIRPADAKPPTPPGLSAYLSRTMQGGLLAGVRFLVDSLALLVGIIIGGLVWWLLLIVAIFAVRAWRRRRQAAA